MVAGEEQGPKGRAAQASAMLLSLLFSVWLAVGSLGGGSASIAPELQRAATPKAVVLHAGAAKQAQQPRQPDPAPALPGSATPVLAGLLTYPGGAEPLDPLRPRASAAASPYRARAPPAR